MTDDIWILCDCGFMEHQMRALIIDVCGGEWELAIEMHLRTSRGFWQRLWYGLRYAFGHKSNYGAFDEVIVGREDAERLRDLCNEFLRKGGTPC